MLRITRQTIVRGLIAGCLFPAAATARSQPQPILIYADGLQNGWTIGGWAKNTPQVALEDQKPVEIDMAAWSVFSLRAPQPVEINGYSMITILIHGGAKGRQEFKVSVKNADKAFDGGLKISGLKGKWARFDVALKDLKIADGRFDTIEIQNASGDVQPTAYLNYVLIQ